MYMKRGQPTVSKAVREQLRTTTVRSFEGGLNVADTDLNMSPKFARVLDNLERNLDGTLSLRPGTRLRAVVAPASDVTDIVNVTYFAGYVISVQKSGKITRTDAAGVVTAIPAVAGSPFWTANTFTSVNFTVFNSDLIMQNGVQKPIIIGGRADAPGYLAADILHDKGTLSSVNVPIAKYIATHGRYVIHAWLPPQGAVAPFNSRSRPSTIVISSRDTSGTYVGDPAPNDSVEIDLGSRVSLGDAAITGLVSYRDKLIVTFERGVIPLTLGIYTTTGTAQVHTPNDDGFIGESGCLTHRSLVNVGDDTYFCDNIGVDTLSRVSLLNTLRPHRVSYLVDVLITRALTALSADQIQQFVFAVYDLRNSRYMLFIPVFSAGIITETICFSYTNIPQLQVTAWARLRGWKWTAACRTELKNIIFARENKLYSYEFDDVVNNADRMGDPVAAADLSGEPVNFDWELPWADFDRRLNSKTIRYLHNDTQGTGSYTVSAYADNERFDDTGLIDTPLLSMDFDGSGALGYGADGYGNAYGGGGVGRPTNEERLYAFPMKCNLMKLRFTGSTKFPLRFVSISIMYMRGSVRRS
jgi:hypothetical protein